MMGCYDFCGHYEWTFAWLERTAGRDALKAYWTEAIGQDSQRHARALIVQEGIAGMEKYWGHTLAEESPQLGFSITRGQDVFRIDIHDCPSKGFLLRNGLNQHHDYCDHCIGWIGPMMRDAGFVIDHEHNHCGQCWWEMRPAGTPPGHTGVGGVSGNDDVRRRPNWQAAGARLDRFDQATGPDDKLAGGATAGKPVSSAPPCPTSGFPAASVSHGWQQGPPFPIELGLGGVIAGQQDGVLIAGGGTNFPDLPLSAGGGKSTHAEVFVLPPAGQNWFPAGRLPEPRAYAAAISVPGGVLVAGGENGAGIRQDAFLMSWDGARLHFAAMPPLPAPRTSLAAAVLDGMVYLAGGFGPGDVRQSQVDFWRLALGNPSTGWQALPTWPGPSRGQAVLTAAGGALYLISGLEVTGGPDGTPRTNYLQDAYRYRPDRGWTNLPPPPRPAVAAPTPAPATRDPARIFILGGVDGRPPSDQSRGKRVPDDILVFDLKTESWSIAAERWPAPVVTVPAVQMGGEWWFVSGEIRAGIRTPEVWSGKPELWSA